jgi:predicted protein tyrosine phosphatase
MKLLFICEENLMRSPTAERLVNESGKNKAKSCGTYEGAKKVITQRLINWADLIFVMDVFQKMFIKENFKCNKKIISLEIPDIYDKDNPELIKILKRELKEYL